MARFYVDEDLGLDVVSALRERGHEVEYSLEVGHEQQPDGFHLRHAAANAAALLTGNREDYRFLHRLWVSLVQWDVMPNHHSGILTASRQISAQEWSDAVARLLNDMPNIQGALYTFVTPPGTWHRDRF